MAGLSVLLEAHKDPHGAPQIISKTSMLRPSLSTLPPPPALRSLPTSAFLQACFLCRKRLSQEKDIYMYRGDRAFCSVECRCRQIFMDEEESMGRENCSLAASPTRQREGSRRRARPSAAATASGFAY